MRGGRDPEPQHAATNPRAAYADVVDPAVLFDPLTSEQAARSTDGCVVAVLSTEDRGHHASVWVDGVGWSQDAPSLESRQWGKAVAARRAGEMAYRQADATPGDVDTAEVDDTSRTSSCNTSTRSACTGSTRRG